MAKAVKQHQPRKRWISGEVDADPFMLPQRITIPANEIMYRLFGFIRYAVVYKDAVQVTDSSPILGPFVWDEPIAAFRGVALRVAWRDHKGSKPAMLVQMVHRSDERRSITLHVSFEGTDVAARWRSWGRVLGLPLLLEDREGELQMAERRLGSLRIDTPQPHAGANPLSARRPMTFGMTGRPRLWSNRLMVGTRPSAY